MPNYELAPDLQQVEILRVVVKENMTGVLVDRLVADIVSLSFLLLLFIEPANVGWISRQIEITEQLAEKNSPVHALNNLGGHRSRPKTHEEQHGRVTSPDMGLPHTRPRRQNTYSKTC